METLFAIRRKSDYLYYNGLMFSKDRIKTFETFDKANELISELRLCVDDYDIIEFCSEWIHAPCVVV